MSGADKYDVLVLSSGTDGKFMAWTMAKEGMRTAVVERRYIGGSCANIAWLPSKNVIRAAKVTGGENSYETDMTRPFRICIEAGETKILIDPFLCDNPSRNNGWSGCLTGKNSTQRGDR